MYGAAVRFPRICDQFVFSITIRNTVRTCVRPPDATEPADVTFTQSRLYPPVSDNSVICCVPAPSVAVNETVVHDCHPPVAGTATVVHTLLFVLKPTCMLPPPGDATWSCTT